MGSKFRNCVELTREKRGVYTLSIIQKKKGGRRKKKSKIGNARDRLSYNIYEIQCSTIHDSEANYLTCGV